MNPQKRLECLVFLGLTTLQNARVSNELIKQRSGTLGWRKKKFLSLQTSRGSS